MMFGELYEPVYLFMERGGDVLYAIFGLIFILWLLVLERAAYFMFSYRPALAAAVQEWEARSERRSWHAHQIRQDMWRKLQGMRGFSPVVEVTATGPGSGQALRVRAGGQVMGRVPSNAAGLIADVLENPADRARWQRHAVRRRDKTCPETGPKTNNTPEIAAKFDKGNESAS